MDSECVCVCWIERKREVNLGVGELLGQFTQLLRLCLWDKWQRYKGRAHNRRRIHWQPRPWRPTTRPGGNRDVSQSVSAVFFFFCLSLFFLLSAFKALVSTVWFTLRHFSPLTPRTQHLKSQSKPNLSLLNQISEIESIWLCEGGKNTKSHLALIYHIILWGNSLQSMPDFIPVLA